MFEVRKLPLVLEKKMEYLGDRWGTVCGRRHKITWLREEERKQYLLLKKKEREDLP